MDEEAAREILPEIIAILRENSLGELVDGLEQLWQERPPNERALRTAAADVDHLFGEVTALVRDGPRLQVDLLDRLRVEGLLLVPDIDPAEAAAAPSSDVTIVTREDLHDRMRTGMDIFMTLERLRTIGRDR